MTEEEREKLCQWILYKVDNGASKEVPKEPEKQLCSGVFWILSDNNDLNNYKLLKFVIPCDSTGNPQNIHSVEPNSKSGNIYNHKKIWESVVKTNNKFLPYNKKEYNYYPRGRVEISNKKAVIYLNPHIIKSVFVEVIKKEFGLINKILEIQVKADESEQYQCFLDWR